MVADAVCDGSLGDIDRLTEGRSRRLRFRSNIDPEQLRSVIGQLSASAKLFAHEPSAGGTELLRPLPTEETLVFGSELVTTQRYRGKTNERLTRTMLNIALAAAGIDPSSPLTGDRVPTLLDPMCGRGTTLNWALAYGLNATGIDVERSSLDHHAGFLQTWAKRSRLPHKMQRFRPGNGESRNMTFDVAPERAAFKNGQGQRVQTFNADGAESSLAIKKASIDVIVADLPYGVQHRGSGESASEHGDGSAETGELIERVLDVWGRWLTPRGAICLAWNTKRASRRDLGSILVGAGFTPISAAGGYSMRHVVDATIDRDVIVATRGS